MGYAQDADQIVFTNEVKKALYKQKPTAKLVHQTNHIHQYQCDIWIDRNGTGSSHWFTCNFSVPVSVPVSDMGETVFHNGMHAQLLIRYLDIL